MNLKNSLVPLIFVFSVLPAFSQAKKPPVKSKPPVSAKSKSPTMVNNENSLLWEISGRGLTEPSYLYGTMHIICEEDAQLSDSLKKTIKNVEHIFFEVDMDNMEELMGALKFARMNNGLRISDLVSPVEYQRIEEYFSKNRTTLPFAMMDRFKPYFVSAMISEAMLDCKSKSSIEQQIMSEAKQYDKPISGLESIEFQASIFDSIPYEKQAADLVKYVDSIDSYRKVTLDLLDLYRKQDVLHMDSLISKSDPGMTEYLDIMLYDRNRRWEGQISEQAFTASTLFAVGAGHLGGENGVINLLRLQGFTVKPLKN